MRLVVGSGSKVSLTRVISATADEKSAWSPSPTAAAMAALMGVALLIDPVLVAVTPEGRLLLIEQYRPPVDRVVIELPAGLVGDLPGTENEPLAVGARRELVEETGYDAAEIAARVGSPVGEIELVLGLREER